MIAASDFAAALVGLRPPTRGKIAQPRVQHNPAGIHLISAGRCPNKRRQVFFVTRGSMLERVRNAIDQSKIR